MDLDQLKKLQVAVEAKRKEMVTIGMSKGLSHPDTVRVSQELDELLNRLMEAEKGNQ